MKNKKKYALLLSFALLFICIFPSPMYAETLSSSDIKWSYPISIKDEEYSTLSPIDVMELCTMPDELLAKTSTDHLADLVLDYPLLSGFLFFYEDIDTAIENFCRISNIFREFFSRPDAYSVLIEKYGTVTVDYSMLPTEEELNSNTFSASREKESSFSGSGLIKESFLEYVLGGKANLLTEEQKNLLSKTIEKKIADRKNANSLYANTYGIYTIMMNKFGKLDPMLIPDSLKNELSIYEQCYLSIGDTVSSSRGFIDEDYRFEPNIPANLAVIGFRDTLPGSNASPQIRGFFGMFSLFGVQEFCNKFADENEDDQNAITAWGPNDYTSWEAQEVDNKILEDHPSFRLLSSATARYNCHSYAWISTNTTTNKYRVESLNNWPNQVTTIYTPQTHSSIPFSNIRFGDVIVIKNGSTVTHSAIVTSAGTSTTNIMVKSKFGCSGVFRTTLQEAINYYGTSFCVYRF